jgi:CubicO group peptidase (beta-lactamase class C family)
MVHRTKWKQAVGVFAMVAMLSACASGSATSPASSAKRTQMSTQQLDRVITEGMAATGSRGLAVSVIDRGQVTYTKAYGVRNGAGEPLQTDTVMYGASLTKAVFGNLVVQLAQEGKIDLDASIATYLPQPLPSYNSDADARAYAPWGGLEGDERWRKITPRMLLTHSAGFANFAFLEPDGKLRIHFEPGTRYAYSGAGIMLLQFVLERGLGLDTQSELQRRFFTPYGMSRTSLKWRDDFRPNLADGFGADGKVEAHDERSRVRAAGSMDTTISDMGAFAAAYSRGAGLSATTFANTVRGRLPILTRSQFPSLQTPPQVPVFPGLAAGLGVVSFEGPQGAGFYKGGHNDTTANTWVCVEAGQRCIVILSNDVRSEAMFPAVVKSVLGETGVPWTWEYGEMAFWEPVSTQ